MNLKVLNTVVWSWSSDQTEEERWQEGILGKQSPCLGLCATTVSLEDSTEIRLWGHGEPDHNLRRKHWCWLNGHWRAFIEAANESISAEKIQRWLVYPASQNHPGWINQWKQRQCSPEGPEITWTSPMPVNRSSEGARGMEWTPLYGMFKLQVENWAQKLLPRCCWGWEAANLT